MRFQLFAAAMLLSTPSFAMGPTVQHYLPDYACARLKITSQQAMDPRGGGVVVRTAPDAAAPVGTTASSVLFVKQPLHQIGRFVEVLQITGQPGWIERSYIAPMGPLDQCHPAMMSNGRVGPAP